MDVSWLKERLSEAAIELANEQKNPGWFSVSAISNVPFVNFPTLNQDECRRVQEETQNVLKISRNYNQYKEVSITYKYNEPKDENKNYAIVYGDFNVIKLMKDEQTKRIVSSANEENSLVVINLHNHPNDTKFSLNDLLIFTENNSIKLMQIVNKNGEVSFLLKPQLLDLTNIVFKNILETIPNFLNRLNDFVEKSSSKEINLREILNAKERTKIVNNSLIELQSNGVIYIDYVNKIKANQLFLNLSSNNQIVLSHQSIGIDSNINNDNLEEDYEYGWEE